MTYEWQYASWTAANFFDLTPKQQNVVLIDATTLQKEQRLIAGCETCSEDTEIPFENCNVREIHDAPTNCIANSIVQFFRIRHEASLEKAVL